MGSRANSKVRVKSMHTVYVRRASEVELYSAFCFSFGFLRFEWLVAFRIPAMDPEY